MKATLRRFKSWACSGALVVAISGPAAAEEIVVSNYGVSANGMPYAVALEKGFFKEEGANVTGILTSAGGGTTLRNMLAGNAPYAEVNPNAVIAAIQQGADIRIVADTVLTVAEFSWAVKPDSPVKSVADLRGKKFGYTNPRSTSQALATLVLQSGGLKTADVNLVKTGGFGEGVAALDIGLVDAAPIPEPLWSKFRDKYRIIATASELLPPIANVLGVAHANPSGKEEFIKAVIRARRKAVAFMTANPDESGDIIAKVYNLEPAVARAAVRNPAAAPTASPTGARAKFTSTGSIAPSRCRRPSAPFQAMSISRRLSIPAFCRTTCRPCGERANGSCGDRNVRYALHIGP